jgi:hypothetical protein
MGLMYIIWDEKIWNADTAAWQPYHGTSAHIDHAHISMSWAGALSQTSFWSGKVLEGLPEMPSGLERWSEPSVAMPKPAPSATPGPSTKPATKPSPTLQADDDAGSDETPTKPPRRRTPQPTTTPSPSPAASAPPAG